MLRFLVYLRSLHGPGHVVNAGSVQFTSACSLLLEELKLKMTAAVTTLVEGQGKELGKFRDWLGNALWVGSSTPRVTLFL